MNVQLFLSLELINFTINKLKRRNKMRGYEFFGKPEETQK